MTYNEILPLPEVKNYLRLDADFTADDEAIERMVRAAFEHFEDNTGHIIALRENVVYNRPHGERWLDIYQRPVTYTGELTKIDGFGVTKFDADTVTVTLGYTSRDKIKSKIIEAVLQMVKIFYFEAEKQIETTLIPESVNQIIHSEKHSIVY